MRVRVRWAVGTEGGGEGVELGRMRVAEGGAVAAVGTAEPPTPQPAATAIPSIEPPVASAPAKAARPAMVVDMD